MSSRASRRRDERPLASYATLGLAVALALAVSLLPFNFAVALVGGGALGLLAFLRPTFGLGALAVFIPFGGLVETTFGSVPAEPAEWAIGLFLAGWIARVLVHRERVTLGPLFWPMLLFVGTALLAATFAENLTVALKVVIRFWIELLLVYLAALNLLRDETRRRFVLAGILVAGLIQGLLGVYQFLTATGPAAFGFGGFLRAYGTFGQPNPYAGYIELVAPLALALVALWLPGGRSRLRRLALASGLVGALALLMSLSRGGWLGAAVGIGVGVLVETRRKGLVVVGAVALAGLAVAANQIGLLPETISQRLAQATDYFRIFDARGVVPTAESFAIVERMAHWQAGWEMLLDHPLVGVGPGHYGLAYARYAILPYWKDSLGHAHNIYLNIAAENGLLGLLAYLAMIASWLVLGLWCARRLASSDRTGLSRAIAVGVLACLVAIAVHGLFDNLYVHMLNAQVGLLLGLLGAVAAEAGGSPSRPVLRQ